MLYPHKYRRTLEKAVEILKNTRFSNEIEAYEILVKNEDKLELPASWELVVDALEILNKKGDKGKEKN